MFAELVGLIRRRFALISHLPHRISLQVMMTVLVTVVFVVVAVVVAVVVVWVSVTGTVEVMWGHTRHLQCRHPRVSPQRARWNRRVFTQPRFRRGCLNHPELTAARDPLRDEAM